MIPMSNELEFIVYSTPAEDVRVDAAVKDETVWLTQKGMAELFGVGIPAISKHLKNIFEEGELRESVVVSNLEITTPHGAMPGKTQQQKTKFYNLDAIISVGYRVNSRRATQFRIWATGVLKEYMLKGFALDDDRLKQGKTLFGKDYFRELLERVRSIRASERRIWQQITDIFRNAVSTTTRIRRLHVTFTPWCKINFIMPLPGRPVRKLFIPMLITQNSTWD